MLKKCILDLRVLSNECPHPRYALLRLTTVKGSLPPMVAGQFAQLRIDGVPSVFLRRPVSIHFVDPVANEVWFLVQLVGAGTKWLGSLRPGDVLNAVLPLGKGFSMPDRKDEKILLVGGGVGVAPLLFLGQSLRDYGVTPTFLLGARTKADLLQLPFFERLGPLYLTTEDGSAGEKGFVTQHSVLREQSFDSVRCCGPRPMMMAVACYAKGRNIDCEVSLENLMACGLGACLCCVEDTQQGNVCVCKEGPVFNINELKWQI